MSPLSGLVQGLLLMVLLSTLCLSFPMLILGKESLGPFGRLESPKGTFKRVRRAEGGDPSDQLQRKAQSPGKGTSGTEWRSQDPSKGEPWELGRKDLPTTRYPNPCCSCRRGRHRLLPGSSPPSTEDSAPGQCAQPRPAPLTGHAHQPRLPRPFVFYHASALLSPQRDALREEPN